MVVALSLSYLTTLYAREPPARAVSVDVWAVMFRRSRAAAACRFEHGCVIAALALAAALACLIAGQARASTVCICAAAAGAWYHEFVALPARRMALQAAWAADLADGWTYAAPSPHPSAAQPLVGIESNPGPGAGVNLHVSAWYDFGAWGTRVRVDGEVVGELAATTPTDLLRATELHCRLTFCDPHARRLTTEIIGVVGMALRELQLNVTVEPHPSARILTWLCLLEGASACRVGECHPTKRARRLVGVETNPGPQPYDEILVHWVRHSAAALVKLSRPMRDHLESAELWFTGAADRPAPWLAARNPWASYHRDLPCSDVALPLWRNALRALTGDVVPHCPARGWAAPTAALMLLAAFAYLALQTRWRIALRRCYTALLDRNIRRGAWPDVKLVRETVDSTPTPDVTVDGTHAKSATARASARAWLQAIAVRLGVRVFETSTTGARGERLYYDDRDLATGCSTATPDDEDAVLHVDDDYFRDMSYELAAEPRVRLVYTVVPTAAAAVRDDYSYTFHGDEFEQTVNGVRTYKHALHCWARDSFIATSQKFPWRYASGYEIVRNQIDADHQALVVVPRWTFTSFFPWDWFLTGPRFGRLRAQHGAYTVLDVVGPSGRKTSIARQGTYVATTLSAAQIDTAANQRDISVNNWHVSSVVGALPDIKREEAVALTAYLVATRPTHDVMSCVAKTPTYAYTFREADGHFADDTTPLARAYGTHFIEGAQFVARRSHANAQKAIDERSTRVAPVNLQPSKNFFPRLDAFVRQLCGAHRHSVRAYDRDEVFERQPTLAQRRNLQDGSQSLLAELTTKVKSFLKSEPTKGIVAPRLITTLDNPSKLTHSAQIYALTDFLKSHARWFMPGKKPIEVSRQLDEIAARANKVLCGDLDKQDGRYSNLARVVLHAVCYALVHPDERTRLTATLMSQFRRRGIFYAPDQEVGGIEYKTEFQVLSGSPQTSFADGVLTAFILFDAHMDQGETEDEAYANIGAVTGDDSFSPDLNGDYFERAAARVGQKGKRDEYARGTTGMNFLATVYGPGLGYGDLNCMPDPKRFWPKLFLTTQPPTVKGRIIFAQKCAAYNLFSRGIKELDELFDAAAAANPLAAPSAEVYNAQFGAGVQYVSHAAAWKDEFLEGVYPGLRLDLLSAFAKRVASGESDGTDAPTLWTDPKRSPDPNRETAEVNGNVLDGTGAPPPQAVTQAEADAAGDAAAMGLTVPTTSSDAGTPPPLIPIIAPCIIAAGKRTYDEKGIDALRVCFEELSLPAQINPERGGTDTNGTDAIGEAMPPMEHVIAYVLAATCSAKTAAAVATQAFLDYDEIIRMGPGWPTGAWWADPVSKTQTERANLRALRAAAVNKPVAANIRDWDRHFSWPALAVLVEIPLKDFERNCATRWPNKTQRAAAMEERKMFRKRAEQLGMPVVASFEDADWMYISQKMPAALPRNAGKIWDVAFPAVGEEPVGDQIARPDAVRALTALYWQDLGEDARLSRELRCIKAPKIEAGAKGDSRACAERDARMKNHPKITTADTGVRTAIDLLKAGARGDTEKAKQKGVELLKRGASVAARPPLTAKDWTRKIGVGLLGPLGIAIFGRGAYTIMPRQQLSMAEAKKMAREVGGVLVPKGAMSRAGGRGGQALGRHAGKALAGDSGAKAGAALGKALGKKAGAAVARLTGFGSYAVQHNTLYKQGGSIPEGTPVPTFANPATGSDVYHRDFIADVLVPADVGFHVTAYPINPANTTFVPWLARIATSFQQYEILGMVVEYRSRFSDYTTGGALGVVALGTNYNANDSLWANRADMENAEYTVSEKPSLHQVHAIECMPAKNPLSRLYVRTGADVGAVEDNRLYDLGIFQVATEGVPGTPGTLMGSVYVTYHVRLYKPFIPPADAATSNTMGLTWLPTGVTFDTPWGVGGITDNPAVGAESGAYRLGNVFQRQGTPAVYELSTRCGGPVAVRIIVQSSIPKGELEEPPDLNLIGLRINPAGPITETTYMADDTQVVTDGGDHWSYVQNLTVMFTRPYHSGDDGRANGVVTAELQLPPEVEDNGGAFRLVVMWSTPVDPRTFNALLALYVPFSDADSVLSGSTSEQQCDRARGQCRTRGEQPKRVAALVARRDPLRHGFHCIAPSPAEKTRTMGAR